MNSANQSRPVSFYVPPPRHARPGASDRDSIVTRMHRVATLIGEDGEQFTDCKYPGEPRWRIDARWVEFECGCRAERALTLAGARPWDPIIFRELPEQAVYDHVCAVHEPQMNKRVRGLGFATFDQWHRARRPRLMGR